VWSFERNTGQSSGPKLILFANFHLPGVVLILPLFNLSLYCRRMSFLRRNFSISKSKFFSRCASDRRIFEAFYFPILFLPYPIGR